MATVASPESLQAALRYAEAGLPVLPVWGLRGKACACPKGARCQTPGKHPIGNDWPKRATTDPQQLRLSMRVNGEVRQQSTTANMLFTVAQLISVLSAGMTLEPGDLLATGTPEGVAKGMKPPKWLQPGDVMEAEVEGIGVLRNRVVAPR